MGWDKKYYNEIKKFMLHELNHVPFVSDCRDPFEWAKSKLPLVSSCLHREDYEGAKATSDAIREFLNQFLPEPIPLDATLNLPDYKEVKIHGIICYVGKNDYMGGGAEII